MYINEKSWEVHQAIDTEIECALLQFIKLYSVLGEKYGAVALLVPDNMNLNLYSKSFALGKWLARLQQSDREAYRVFMGFWQRKVVYQVDDEYEFTSDSHTFTGAMEAAINDSFIISLCIDEMWKRERLEGNLYCLLEDSNRKVTVDNLYMAEQLLCDSYISFFKNKEAKIYSYDDLWEKREKLFPHLEFCPSVEKNLKELQISYINQVMIKLTELNRYSQKYSGEKFRPELLTKITLESERTLKEYAKEHTFYDIDKKSYLAKWHMRFTGIPGRIFFVPNYSKETILICYIGKKLPNPT